MTRLVRFPAPDIARGFMLLLIALANVTWWVTSTAPGGTADQWWVLVRTGLVDQRAYPLFALLFGFGLAVLASRAPAPDGDHSPARRVLRRRGWWLLVFGCVHALFFPGDIVGLYGLLAVLLAGLIAAGRLRVLGALGITVALLTVAAVAASASAPKATTDTAGMQQVIDAGTQPWPLEGLLYWVVSTLGGVLVSMVVPALVLGVWVARRTTLLTDPAGHRRTLTMLACTGLAVGFAAGLPHGLFVADFAESAPLWTAPLNQLGALVSAAGWLALTALLALVLTGTRAESAHREITPWSAAGVLTATGRRSLTAYLAQTVLFLAVFRTLEATGTASSVGPLAAAAIAVAVWVIVALACAALAAAGRRGPAETLLRRLSGSTTARV